MSFNYKGSSFEYPIRIMIIPKMDNDYYFEEARVLFDADVKSGKLNKYLFYWYGLGRIKNNFPLSLSILLVLAIASIVIPPVLVNCLNNHQDITVEVPEINGLSFSNLNANIGQDFSTNISVDPVTTNGQGLPDALTSVTSGNHEIKNNEYVYTLNPDKINASLEIPGRYIKGDIIIDFNLTDNIIYTVSFDLNGGEGETPPSQTFNYNDTERLVEEPEIPTHSKYDFVGWFLDNKEEQEYDFFSNVNSDLTLYACYDIEGRDAVTAYKDNETKGYKTLGDFRNAVNNDTDNINGFDGWTVKLNKYINLHNIHDKEWTPIGTGEHPFKGIFDGRNKTVYNFKVPYNNVEDPIVDTCGGALFGYVEGTSSVLHNDSPLEDFYNSETYEVTPPAEDTFSCVIKNLKLKNVETANIGESNGEDYTSALVSSVNNAYISNVKLDDSNITADNKVGGIVGTVIQNGVAVFDRLTTTKKVTVNGTSNHVTGIFARVYNTTERVLALNCTNNANVIGGGTNTSGISGQAKYTLFYNCINNGTITGTNRTAGIATDVNESVFIKCTNNGNVSQSSIDYIPSDEQNAPGGIASYGETYSIYIYKCTNNGTIGSNGNKKITAGIISTGLAPDSIVKDCINAGAILSEHAYDICELANIPVVKNDTSLSSLNEHLMSNKYIIANNIVLTDSDKTLKPNNQQEKIELNNLNGNIVLDLNNASSLFTLDIDNCKVSVINADTNKSLKIIGSGNVITIETDIGDVTVSNDLDLESTVIITKTAGRISMIGVGKTNCEINQDAKVERVSFGDYGSNGGTHVLTNRGVISHNSTTGNQHTVSTIFKCNITIYNYGTIEALENNSNANSFALLFYNQPTVTIYADSGSYVRCSSTDNHILSAGSANHVDIYYKDDAMMDMGGKIETFKFDTDVIESHEWK